ncbi:MAG: AMP-binding protein [Sneathiella sp.]|nr:AMP-binding protein [Sneathiella sp.]
MTSDDISPLWPWIKSAAELRRSVRAFLDKPVSDELLEEVLETSLRAPSGGNLQPWNIVILKGAVKERLGAAIRAAYRDKNHQPNDEYPYYPDTWESPFKERRQGAADQLYNALEIGRRDVTEKRDQQARNYDFFGAPIGLLFTMPRDLSQGAWIDMGIYLGQLQLLLEGAGLGTCLQASFISYSDVIRDVLDIAADQMIVCGMAVGYADMTHPVNGFQTSRKTLSDTLMPVPKIDPIGARILKNGALFPTKPALKIGAETLSWREFAYRVRQSAVLINKAYEGKDLALSMSNSPRFVEIFLAGQVMGKNMQVLDPAWPDSWAADAIGDTPLITAQLQGEESTVQLPDIDVDAAFYTGFTSGSTGRPKGFVRSMASWLESFKIDTAEFNLSPDDVIAAIGNFVHSLPLYAAIRGLYEGGTVVAFPSFHPKRVLDEISDQKVSIIYAVPTQLDALCRAAGEVNFPSVRWILSSGAKCSEDLFDQLKGVFPNAELAEFYGSSELSFISVAKKSEHIPDGSVGRPVGPVSVQIHSFEDGVAPAGEVGRVYVKSPLKFMGYLGQGHQLSADEGFYTGDVGYLDAEGLLYLTGRADRMINSKGRNIFPEKIEAVLSSHAAVQNAAVFGISDPTRGQDMIAVLHLRDNVTAAEITKHCRLRLPDYMLPRRFYVAIEWIETASGKSHFPKIRSAFDGGEYEVLS